MLTKNFTGAAEQLLAIADVQKNNFAHLLGVGDTVFTAITSDLTSRLAAEPRELKDTVDSRADIFRAEFDPFTVYQAAQELLDVVQKMPDSVGVSIVAVLREALTKYGAYLNRPSTQSAWAFVQTASEAFAALKMYKALLGELIGVIDSPTKEATFWVSFPDDLTVRQVAKRLDLIDAINTALSVAARQDDGDIYVRRIEQGSTLFQFRGKNTRVIAQLIRDTARHVFRHFFKDVELSHKVHLANDVLKLREALQSEGIKTAGIDDSLEKVAEQIGQDLVEFIGPEPSIEIDGTEINAGKIAVEVYQEESAQKRLTAQQQRRITFVEPEQKKPQDDPE